ncbi:MAG: NAD(P)-binding domain-containing protein [Myxococcaceae bacterium]
MAKKIAIIGKGNVGSALEKGLTRAGREVKAVGNDKAAVQDTAKWGDIVILAVPFSALDDVVKELGDTVNGKTVVDVTNALGPDMSFAIGFTTSGAEELQKKLPRARVVKAFNTVLAQHMSTGHLGEDALSAFVAADDPAAKRDVLDLAREIGFDTVDAGPLRNARHLEPLGYLNIQLAYVQNMGTDIGFGLFHSPAS